MCQYTVTVPIYDSLECASEWALGLSKEMGLTSDSFFLLTDPENKLIW
jgi:hypothetical protein